MNREACISTAAHRGWRAVACQALASFAPVVCDCLNWAVKEIIHSILIQILSILLFLSFCNWTCISEVEHIKVHVKWFIYFPFIWSFHGVVNHICLTCRRSPVWSLVETFLLFFCFGQISVINLFRMSAVCFLAKYCNWQSKLQVN